MSWSEDDQDKALSWMRQQAEVCSGCGTRPVEWENDRFAYVAEQHLCPGCEVMEQERRNVKESRSAGVRIVLVPRSQAQTPE